MEARDRGSGAGKHIYKRRGCSMEVKLAFLISGEWGKAVVLSWSCIECEPAVECKINIILQVPATGLVKLVPAVKHVRKKS